MNVYSPVILNYVHESSTEKGTSVGALEALAARGQFFLWP